jgi:hypothetical protein
MWRYHHRRAKRGDGDLANDFQDDFQREYGPLT